MRNIAIPAPPNNFTFLMHLLRYTFDVLVWLAIILGQLSVHLHVNCLCSIQNNQQQARQKLQFCDLTDLYSTAFNRIEIQPIFLQFVLILITIWQTLTLFCKCCINLYVHLNHPPCFDWQWLHGGAIITLIFLPRWFILTSALIFRDSSMAKHNLTTCHKIATLMATTRVATVLFVFQELNVHDSAFQLR